MKKLLLFTLFSIAVLFLNAQSIQEGNKQLYYERYQSAETTFQQLLKQNTNNAEAWYGLTKAYLLQKEFTIADNMLRAAPETVRREPFYQVAMGALLLHQGEITGASNYFSEALEATKHKDAVILAAVAEAQINAKDGNSNYAVDLLSKAIKRDKRNANLYIILGDAYRKLHNGSEAYKAYKEALEKDDKSAAAYHRIGEIFLTQKNVDLYVDYFQKAVAADPAYAPSLYKLYAYEFTINPAKAMEYYMQYADNADASIQNEYNMADLLYLNKQYDKAILKANDIIDLQDSSTNPRLYKLIGYSYAAKNDSLKALEFMEQYFVRAPDSLLIAKDYETMSELYVSTDNDSLASVYLTKAIPKVKDSTVAFSYYKKLADLAKAHKNFSEQAKWLQLYYNGNPKANNIDLYYWALAHYTAEEYAKADTVFGMYAAKYPEQSFGYYWQARSKALLDNDMKDGLAVPAYQKLIEVLKSDTTDGNYTKWMVEAYGYLASYEANKEKDYSEAVSYFEKVLEVDPANEDAKKYIALLEKQIDK
jgi:tetratricopeptide (TPR) repeat protein